jgi:hypothetical protein
MYPKTPKCKTCGKLIQYHDDRYDDATGIVELLCDADDIRRHKANLKRRARVKATRAARADAMDSIGMVRVRGNLGGYYYE